VSARRAAPSSLAFTLVTRDEAQVDLPLAFLKEKFFAEEHPLDSVCRPIALEPRSRWS